MVRKLKGGRTANGASNQMDILKQAQSMQQQMMVVQEGLKEKELLEVKLSDEIVKEAIEDKEMLEDLILSAVKEAMRQADELAEAEMGKVTGGINIPGLF